MEWGGMDWIELAQVEDSREHGNEVSGAIKYWKILEYLSD
jgi:hypothetical protein